MIKCLKGDQALSQGNPNSYDSILVKSFALLGVPPCPGPELFEGVVQPPTDRDREGVF